MADHPNAKFENYEKLDIIGIYYQCALNSEQAAEEYLNRGSEMKILSLLFLGFCLNQQIIYITSDGILQPRHNGVREIISLDGLWDFAPNNITVPPGTNKPNVNNDLYIVPVPASYNDVGTQKGLREYAGAVTYRREFFVPSSWRDKRIWIRFGSVCYSANVGINGIHVVSHSIGHLPFGAEVSSVINVDRKNVISVVVDNTLSESTIPQGGLTTLGNGMLARTYTFDFFDYSGIDRSVLLYTTSKSYVDDITITTTLNGTNGIINYEVSIKGDTNPYFHISVLDSSDNLVLVSYSGASSGSLTIYNAILWWPYTMDENPGYLYTFRVDIIKGTGIVDRYDQPFGIRELTWDDTTFKINGKPLYLRGFGKHEDSDFRGKGTDWSLFIRDHNLIRWLGANSYRTSHYPYSEELMDLADRLGLLIINEVPSVNTAGFGDELLENHKLSFTELYNRDKNRPSVVSWSCANEPKTQYNESAPYFKAIVDHIKSLDTSRPVTAAIAQAYDVDNIGQYLDIIGFNRYQAWYENTADLEGITQRIIEEAENWHIKYNKPVFCTEYGADTLEGLNILPTYIWTEEFQQTLMSRHFEAFDKLRQNHDWFIGEHIWNFADFKTAEAYTRVGGNKKGIFTRNRQPKASAFLLRRRYWALAHNLNNVTLPADLDYYVETLYNIKDEL